MYATEKQINYILHLADKKGLSTDWMDSTWKGYASMRERQGKVVDFLQKMTKINASKLIKALKP